MHIPQSASSLPTGGWVLEGYAARFGEVDGAGDVIAKGAFRRSLDQDPRPRMLFQHAPDEPVGIWFYLAEDSHGLFIRGQLNSSVSRARELAALIESGGIDGLSIGFRARRAGREETRKARLLLDIDLWEVSIVTFPMQMGARITRILPTEQWADERRAADLRRLTRLIEPKRST